MFVILFVILILFGIGLLLVYYFVHLTFVLYIVTYKETRLTILNKFE